MFIERQLSDEVAELRRKLATAERELEEGKKREDELTKQVRL